MMDPLFDRDKDFAKTPWLASSWDMNNGGKEWVFHLRPGIEFSDGSPITADDVVFTINYYKTADSWKGYLESLVAVTAVDANTVKFELSQPRADFWEIPGTFAAYYILSQKAVQTAGTASLDKLSATSGPWMLKEYVARDHATLVRNPHYWMLSQGYPKISTIRWNFVEDSTAAIAAVQSGSAQLTQPLAPAAAPNLKKDPNVTVLQVPSPGLFGWGFHKDKPPFSDVHVRQALGLLLEVDQAVTNCWYGALSPLFGGLAASWQPFFNKTDAPEPWKAPMADRVAQANQMLQDAGWIMGTSGVRVSKGIAGIPDNTPLALTPVYQSNDTGAACASQLLPAWLMRGGVSVKPQALDPAAYYGDVGAGKDAMWFAGWYSYLSWQTLMDNVVLSTAFGNPFTVDYKSPEIDAKIKAADAETDPATQVKDYAALEKEIAGLSLYWAIGGQSVSILTSSKLSGYYARLDYSNRSLITSELLP